jgi:hypothetical protein
MTTKTMNHGDLAQHADVLVTRGPGDRVGHALKRKDPDEEPANLSP